MKPFAERMKNNRRKMCAECPFHKNSQAGWLGPHTTDELFALVHSEMGFACHIDVDKEISKNGRKSIEVAPIEQCAGAILHAIKTCKTFQNPQLEEHRMALKGSPEIENVLGFEFKKHHSFGERNAKTLAKKLFVCNDCGKESYSKEEANCVSCNSSNVDEVSND